jgi:quercetin dioxygenase-like cupin family protein
MNTTMKVEDFEAALRKDGFTELLMRQQPPGYFMGDHQHGFDARALIIQGDITLTVAGLASAYPTGTVFELACGTPHKERAGPEGVTYLVGRRST